jgi:hypothetical protein
MNLKSRHASLMLDVISALRFQDADHRGLRSLAQSDSRGLLDAADRTHITLPLAIRCSASFPPDAQQRLRGALDRNALCHEKVLSAYSEIAEVLELRHIDFLVLKGLAQWPWYVDDARYRSQSDIDIYCPTESLGPAREVLAELGYKPVHGDNALSTDQPTDHLPVMIRKSGWTWRNDYYDPERPPSVELHFRFWDSVTEGFEAGNVESFWAGRVRRTIGGSEIPTLSVADGLKYSAMHLIRHLLRGDLQVRHVYELAHFLERSAGEDAFWSCWECSDAKQDRMIEAIAFRLASEWFRCRMHPAAHRLMTRIPMHVDRWFRLFGLSPAIGVMKPNKDELWLHLCLVTNGAARRRIAMRRLFPIRRQRVVLEPHVDAGRGPVMAMRRMVYEASFLSGRALHHCRTLVPMLKSGFRWWKAGTVA